IDREVKELLFKKQWKGVVSIKHSGDLNAMRGRSSREIVSPFVIGEKFQGSSSSGVPFKSSRTLITSMSHNKMTFMGLPGFYSPSHNLKCIDVGRIMSIYVDPISPSLLVIRIAVGSSAVKKYTHSFKEGVVMMSDFLEESKIEEITLQARNGQLAALCVC
ncbi:hypothetical protein ADUPG1_005892, partial [Aduncisulcus paluster]